MRFSVTAGVVFLIVILVGGFVMLSIAGAVDEGGIDREFEKAQAFCNQTYGSPDIVNSQVMGQHGGWHCNANDGNRPDLHQWPDDAFDEALRAEQGDGEFDPDEYDVEKAHPGPFELPVIALIVFLATGIMTIIKLR